MYLGTQFCFCYHCKLFVFIYFRCFRALSTQQGGYVRATNLYYYYYDILIHKLEHMPIWCLWIGLRLV